MVPGEMSAAVVAVSWGRGIWSAARRERRVEGEFGGEESGELLTARANRNGTGSERAPGSQMEADTAAAADGARAPS